VRPKGVERVVAEAGELAEALDDLTVSEWRGTGQ
jgi:hypothetical protein